MIYVILSSAFKNGSNTEYESLLKIGYCRDDREKVRTTTYLTENPTIKVLFTIPGGTEQDEKNLHHHFRKYLKYGNEWFSYNQEILDFFTTHTTKESLLNLDLHLSKKKLTELQKERDDKFLENKQKYINPILHSLENVNEIEYITKQEELVETLNKLFLTSSDIDSYFRSNYPSINFDIPEKLSKKARKILQEFDERQYFTGKMKYLYSLNMEPDIAKQVLDNIYDTRFSKYYWTISAGRAGSLGYQSGKLEDEYNKITNPGDKSDIERKVQEKIFNTFLVGNKYSKVDIKEKLREIYLNNSYDISPKASDLEKYFEIKLCKISNKETGKRDMGFEIIKIKGGDQNL